MINTLISILLFLNTSTHEHYTSISNIHFTSTKNIEVVMEFTAHDLEYYFEKEHNQLLKLGSIKEFKDCDSLLFDYISKHFFIEINNNKVKFNFIGKEVNNDESLLIYLEKKSVKNVKNLTIFNDLLCKYYPNQQNIVHLDGFIKNSFTFNSKETIHKFK